MNDKHHKIIFCIALCVLSLFFLGKPLLNIQTHYYSPANIAQFFSLTKTSYEPTNIAVIDIFQQMHPWMILNNWALRQGEIPLWNPFNGLGVPHLANYQSAVFSIYSLPFYLFDFQYASILSSLMKIVGCGVFTFLFLRLHIKNNYASALGAVIYMFCGYSTLLLQWQHSSVMPSLPAALYFITQIIRGKSSYITIWGLVASLAFGVLAGHPETFYSILVLICLYSLYLLTSANHTHTQTSIYHASLLLFLGLISAGVAALQLIPFFEYAYQSGALTERIGFGHTPKTSALWPLMFYPDLIGNPTTPPYYFEEISVKINHVEANLSYVGGLTIFLAIVGLLQFKKNKEVRFWTIFTIGYLLYAYQPINIGWVIKLIPGLSHVPIQRTDAIFTFSLACLATFGFNSLLHIEGAKLKKGMVVGILGSMLLITSIVSANELLNTFFKNQTDENWKQGWQQVGQNRQLFLIVTYLCGLFFIVGNIVFRKNIFRAFLAIGIVLVVFLQTGYYYRNYFPITHLSSFYPYTDAIKNIKKLTNNQHMVIWCESSPLPGLIPDSNIPYKIKMPSQYEVLHTKYYPKILSSFFDTYMSTVNAGRADCFKELSLRGLQVLRIPYVLAQNSKISPSIANNAQKTSDILPDWGLYKIDNISSSYYIVQNAEFIASDEAILNKIQNEFFDPNKTVILAADSIDITTYNQAQLNDNSLASVETVNELFNEVHLKTHTSKSDNWLVIAIAYYPGWKAYINGIEQHVFRANYGFSAIRLPSGENTVLFKYEPFSFKIGALITLISLISLVLLTILNHKKYLFLRKKK